MPGVPDTMVDVDCPSGQVCWSATSTVAGSSVTTGGCIASGSCDTVKSLVKGDNIKVRRAM